MLVLSRKVTEQILIGDSIQVTVLQIKGGTVRLGIDAPQKVRVRRTELLAATPSAPVWALEPSATVDPIDKVLVAKVLLAKAQLGDRVRVQYLGLIKGDTGFGYSYGREVLEFNVGSHEVIHGISFGVVGMAEGEAKRLIVPPQEAHGAVRVNLIREIARRRFPAHLQLQVGQRLTATSARSGHRRRATVVELGTDTVVVDGNHPLAGEVMKVELQLLSLHCAAASVGGPL